MEKKSSKQILRRPKAYVSSLVTNSIHLRNPWVTAWWSAAFPGFGHSLLGNNIKGFLLIIWEIIININSGINMAIIYSFTGRFDQAKAVININWILLYTAFYIYAIWDSYRLTVDLNNYAVLADREGSLFDPCTITPLIINILDKRNPWMAAVWSMLTPGLGQIYAHNLPKGFFILLWWIFLCIYSHLLPGIHSAVLGDFSRATAIFDPKWLLFMPSIHIFAIYDAYVCTVEQNKLFETEQAMFLKTNYQQPGFLMPFQK